jgi:type II secretory pathway pseudopilin PulG
MEKMKKLLKPQFIIIIVLIIVVLGISLVYAVYQSSLNKEKQAKIEELQKKINNLTDSIESLQTDRSQVANQQQNQLQSIVGPWPEYTNEIIGFSLTLPDTWEGYLLTEGNGFVDFGFEEQNPVARINVIGHEQWEQVRQQENNGLVYVGETENFVIIYSLVAQTVNEDIDSLILEFPEIISTLTMLEGELIVEDYTDETIEEEDSDNANYDEGTDSEEEILDAETLTDGDMEDVDGPEDDLDPDLE